MRKINDSIGLNQTGVSLNDRFISAVGYNPEKPMPKVPADLQILEVRDPLILS